MTKTLTLLFLVCASMVTCASARASDSEDSVVLGIGRSIEWPSLRQGKIFVSDGRVIRVVDHGAKLKITGKKLGTSNVRIGSRDVEVTVLPAPSYRLYQELSKALENRRGLTLAIRAGDPKPIRVRGRLLRMEDWIALTEKTSGARADYVFEAELDAELKEKALAHFERVLSKNQLPGLKPSLEPSARLEVPTVPSDLKRRAQRALEPYGFEIHAATGSIGLEPLVRVRILVAEFKKHMGSRIGIAWPNEAQLLPALGGKDLVVNLHALEENGMGKVLASPTLLCRSGKEAQFLAGGEIPIKTSSLTSQQVIWKKHGILLRIKPRADHDGRMSIAIETEVSMVDWSKTADGIPSLLTNRIETHFDLSSSRTIALSGLIRHEWGKSSSGIPALGTLPILGPLFSSEDFRNDRTELVIFVTPEIVSSEIGDNP